MNCTYKKTSSKKEGPINSEELKKSVFLPQTNFPMKANLPENEPKILQEWEEKKLYERLREKSKGRPKFILHYGPPYANGSIHIGHAFTEGLKDIVVRSYQMAGYDAPLIPGWDCHGLPIEWKIEEDFRKHKKKKEDIPVVEFLAYCREFADKWAKTQKEELKRLGICADWSRPYRTMDFKSEGAIVSQFLKIFMRGAVYQGQKPVMWSTVEKTALAEAEVEYKDYTSLSVYVAFPVVSSPQSALSESCVVIWTTTPWTLPANRALAFHQDLVYDLLEVRKGEEHAEKSIQPRRRFLVAHDLVESFCKTVGISDFFVTASFKGAALEGTLCQHPFDLVPGQTEKDKMSPLAYTFVVPLLSAPFVAADVGTGLVHIAPSHGMDDFLLGKEQNLPMPDIVQEDGTYVENLPFFGGDHVFKVEEAVCKMLRKSGALLGTQKIVHSYPHSWRSRAPLIFRLTKQWFLSMDSVRPQALKAIDNVQWVPTQSKNRIRGMVEARPDWCLSRQRVWGVPVALFLHKETKIPLKDEEVNAKVVERITQEGIEAWHTYPADFFLKPEQQGLYDKVMDTLDVWFDSACTHQFVFEQHEELSWPADVYLEGSDQHRGWFQSSLLESIATTGFSPYKSVVTHGFILDQDGRKMSKSLGNTVSCEDIMSRSGADLLRLWVVNMDYTEDVKIGPEILKRQEDIYRRFRNTLRYLLGALSDFGEENTVPYEKMPELERSILHKVWQLDERHKNCLRTFSLAAFYADLHVFCANDLSSFYFDIRKDCLYCDEKDDRKRRATQTLMSLLFLHVSHWLAPVLCFTAEEAWKYYKGNKNQSIHEQTFPPVPHVWKRPDLDEKWQKIRSVRRVITSAIEQERSSQSITSGLQTSVVLSVPKEISVWLKDVDMAEIAILSQFVLRIAQPQAGAVILDDMPGVGAIVTAAEGEKCPRCWKVTKHPSKENLCKRCVHVLKT